MPPAASIRSEETVPGTPEAEEAIAFAAALQMASGIPVDTLDERWTSKEAERVLNYAPKKRGSRRRKVGIVDEMAASIILRTYLARQSSRSPREDLEEMAVEC